MKSSTVGGRRTVRGSVALALAVVPLGLVSCGEDDSKDSGAEAKPTPLAITTSDAGAKRFTTEAPRSIKGGLVKVVFTNAGKGPHEAQLVRLDGGHTPQEALDIVTSEEPAKIPKWLHFAGGAGAGPGQKATTTLDLPPGTYAVLDTGGGEEGPPPSARGALATFEVKQGPSGTLPPSTATITAADDEKAEHGADHENKHSFKASGLKVGRNKLLFENKGDEPHHAILFPILPGKSLADVKKAFSEERPSGPPPVDFESGAGTAVLDGKTKEVTDLQLRKKGRYALVCFITDRDGKGKEHLQEGMLKEVNVQ
jgi:hypothetical protein